jgi:hypothetical protein
MPEGGHDTAGWISSDVSGLSRNNKEGRKYKHSTSVGETNKLYAEMEASN